MPVGALSSPFVNLATTQLLEQGTVAAHWRMNT
jgi:hypothetical protein